MACGSPPRTFNASFELPRLFHPRTGLRWNTRDGVRLREEQLYPAPLGHPGILLSAEGGSELVREIKGLGAAQNRLTFERLKNPEIELLYLCNKMISSM